MNSLRVKDNDLYVIEVNDEGETIEISKSDPDLPLKIRKYYDDIDKISKEFEKIAPPEDVDNAFEDPKWQEYFKKQSNAYNRMRKATDDLLGEGASQKIFGDHNWYSMFSDLLDALKPHFEAMGFDKESAAKKVKKAVEEKYSDKEEVI